MTLDELKPGQMGMIREIRAGGPIRRRLLELGITPGSSITLQRRAPLGDPLIVCLRDCTLAVRKSDASRILLRDTRL